VFSRSRLSLYVIDPCASLRSLLAFSEKPRAYGRRSTARDAAMRGRNGLQREKAARSAGRCVRAGGAHVPGKDHGGAACARRVAREEMPSNGARRESGVR
jgi:hypothetical protein